MLGVKGVKTAEPHIGDPDTPWTTSIGVTLPLWPSPYETTGNEMTLLENLLYPIYPGKRFKDL